MKNENFKNELIDLLNQALKLEHAIRVQYLTHAKQVTGLNAEPIIAVFHKLADDTSDHEEKFRTLISNYLDGIPCMESEATHRGIYIQSSLNIDLLDEKLAIDFYKKIYQKIVSNKNELVYIFETLEYVVRHIIINKQEHIIRLKLLLK